MKTKINLCKTLKICSGLLMLISLISIVSSTSLVVVQENSTLKFYADNVIDLNGYEINIAYPESLIYKSSSIEGNPFTSEMHIIEENNNIIYFMVMSMNEYISGENVYLGKITFEPITENTGIQFLVAQYITRDFQVFQFEHPNTFTLIYEQEEPCIPNLIYTNWNEWVNNGFCQSNDLQNQVRSRVRYDSNNCGESNQTIYEYRNIACDYCVPNLIYTEWTSWTNTEVCQSNNFLTQIRSRILYDDNYCGETENEIEYDYRETSCDFCTPNLIYTGWSSWSNTESCQLNNFLTQIRYRTLYDSNSCNEVENEVEYDYREIACEFPQSSLIIEQQNNSILFYLNGISEMDGYEINIAYPDNLEYINAYAGNIFEDDLRYINESNNLVIISVMGITQDVSGLNLYLGRIDFNSFNKDTNISITKAEYINDFQLYQIEHSDYFTLISQEQIVSNETIFYSNQSNIIISGDVQLNIFVDNNTNAVIKVDSVAVESIAILEGKVGLKVINISTNLSINNATIKMTLDLSDYEEVKMYYLNETSNLWIELESWTDGNNVYGITNHFSIFGVFGKKKVVTPPANGGSGGGGSHYTTPTPSANQTITKICNEWEKKCDGNDVYVCLGNAWSKQETCEYKCELGKCNEKEIVITSGEIIEDSWKIPWTLESSIFSLIILIIVVMVIYFWSKPRTIKKLEVF